MGALLSTLIGGLIAGIVIGPLARLVLPGKQNLSIGMTIVVGAIGAIVGGLFAQVLGVGDTSGIDWIKLVIQVAVAAVAIIVYANMQANRAQT
jgi:uncharacterized membrane protein YeaQ/YmgE (transglycosylase-associated protein family)